MDKLTQRLDSAAFEPTRRSRKRSELIASDLADYIIEHDLPAGARLPTEREMVETLGAGRATVREALRLLESNGVITMRAGRFGGPIVRRPGAEDLSNAIALILRFERTPLTDIIATREAIEPIAARLAAQRATPEHVAELRGTIEAMLANLGSQTVFLRENQRFHITVAQASGNVVLRVIVDALKGLLDGQWIESSTYSERRRRNVALAHQRVADAIEAGDADAAEAAMQDHLGEAAVFWRKHYGREFAWPVQWE